MKSTSFCRGNNGGTMSDERSEYLQFLPLFFREEMAGGSARELLVDLLLVFQKILTGVRENGVEDPQEIRSTPDGPAYEPLERVIDQLDRFFDPFRTDAKFLPWLASWVGLELQPDWSSAQSRTRIAGTIALYSRSGLKSGIHDVLNLNAASELAPRVSIDDDEALLRRSTRRRLGQRHHPGLCPHRRRSGQRHARSVSTFRPLPSEENPDPEQIPLISW